MSDHDKHIERLTELRAKLRGSEEGTWELNTLRRAEALDYAIDRLRALPLMAAKCKAWDAREAMHMSAQNDDVPNDGHFALIVACADAMSELDAMQPVYPRTMGKAFVLSTRIMQAKARCWDTRNPGSDCFSPGRGDGHHARCPHYLEHVANSEAIRALRALEALQAKEQAK